MGKNIRDKERKAPESDEIKIRKVIYDPMRMGGYYCYITHDDLEDGFDEIAELIIGQFKAWGLKNETKPFHKMPEWVAYEEHDGMNRKQVFRRFIADRNKIENLERVIEGLEVQLKVYQGPLK